MRKIPFLFLALLALYACAPLTKDGPVGFPEKTIVLEPGQSIGQTIAARDSGLEGVEILLAPDISGDSSLVLHLRSGPDSTVDLAVASLSLRQVTSPRFYRFDFFPQGDSQNQDYFLLLELSGNGRVQVGALPGDAYLDGSLYVNRVAQDSQLNFRLAYEPWQVLEGLLLQLWNWLGVLLISALIFVLPGWALLTILPSVTRISGAEKLGLAAGLSLALVPILLLWTNLARVNLGPLYAWAPLAVAAVAIAWHHRNWRPSIIGVRRDFRLSISWLDVATVFVFGLVFLIRFWVVRSLDTPLWGDSYQHATIAQLLLDHGGLFESWEPYAPYSSLTVQFGFPALVADFSWAMGSPIAPATLLVGQIINGLAALTLYPLAVRLSSGNRWAGIGAVLIGGLVSPMPAYYVNWGRYAQLAGQAILPISLWFLCEVVESTESTRRKMCLAAITLAGMLLAYYRMPFYYATFAIAWLVGWGVAHRRQSIGHWIQIGWRLGIVGVIASLLLAPWVSHVAGGQLASAVEVGITQGSTESGVLADYAVWWEITNFVPGFLLAAGLVALFWSLYQRQWGIASLGLWIIGLASLVAGRLIHLPGANMMQNFAVLIALYIPFALLCGWLIGQIARWAKSHTRTLGSLATALLVLGIALWGAWNQRVIVKPETFALVTRPDLKAMAWIRENIPPQARFLVEGFRIYEGRSVVGSDAGWWIPLLTGRANTIPPQYAMLNEKPSRPTYTQQVYDLYAHLEQTPVSTRPIASILCEWGITHVYIGQVQGKVGAEAEQLFAPAQLENNLSVDLVYHQDRVFIYALNSSACEAGK